MPKKTALLIGVSEYGEGIPSLSAPKNDVAAIKQVLEHPSMGAFERVKALIDPDPTSMRLAVQQLFTRCNKDDLILLYFSGHGITNDNNELYFGTKGTTKDFYQATSVAASFIQDVSRDSYAKRQVIVLDCCYSGAFAEGWQAKSIELDLKQELGAEGRVVLTSSTATQKSFQHESNDLSLYTQYLVEGIETGAAGIIEQGRIYACELHDYAKAKVQEAKPKQKPEIITDREGYNILLSQAPVNDPELGYRKTVEKYAAEGHISIIGTRILRLKRKELDITEEQSEEIIDEVLAPYRQRLENIKQYQEVFAEAVDHHYPLTEQYLSELQDFQDMLGLEDRDLKSVKEEVIAEKDSNLQMAVENLSKTLADCNKAMELNPEVAIALNNQNYIHDDLGKYKKAIADYTKAIELNPYDANTYSSRGNAYFNLGEYDQAVADYNQAIKLQPDYANAYYKRGSAYFNLGECDKAITDHNQAIKLQPNYANAYNNRGNVYQGLEEYKKAIADYTKAIELNLDYVNAYYNRGIAYKNRGEYEKAIADYTRAIKLDPDHANAYYNRGLLNKQQRNNQAAIQDFTQAAELDRQQGNIEWYNNSLDQIKELQN